MEITIIIINIFAIIFCCFAITKVKEPVWKVIAGTAIILNMLSLYLNVNLLLN